MKRVFAITMCVLLVVTLLTLWYWLWNGWLITQYMTH